MYILKIRPIFWTSYHNFFQRHPVTLICLVSAQNYAKFTAFLRYNYATFLRNKGLLKYDNYFSIVMYVNMLE